MTIINDTKPIGEAELAEDAGHECRLHFCADHSTDLDGTVDHFSRVVRYSVATDPYADATGQVHRTAEMGARAVVTEDASGAPMDAGTVTVWIGSCGALLTPEQARELGGDIMFLGISLETSAEYDWADEQPEQEPAASAVATPVLPRRRRTFGEWLWEMWEYRPALVTVRQRRVELDEAHIAGVLAGRGIERKNPER